MHNLIDPKDLEPVGEYAFRKSNARRWDIYRTCQKYGHETAMVGFRIGDWVRCKHCESEFRNVSGWNLTQRERDTPMNPEEQKTAAG